ncbi:S1/P1 nuclease [Glomus cerebriforme]|uniref:S1/P1 nuclease n=1 Tax=Glomus cerebriforme TaxID=658196 RepID=A0A397T336_9GLOM|nr:S1/P1 nuclease [Glomus cerebriforme]
MKSFLTILLPILLTSFITIPSPVNAWGAEAHKTIGQIAQNFLKPDIARKVAALFQDKSFGGQLPLASLWADEVKHRRGPFGVWSAPLHFLDTLDDPGRSCSVDMERDCPDAKCVVGAIANYTTQLDCANGYDKFTRDIALRFLAHFFGDITQPLHVCGREKGGNEVIITFDGQRENLHAIWDTQMVEKRLQDFESDFVQYSDFLTKNIQNGEYTSESKDWVSCNNSPNSTTLCPLTWAIDTNAINCPFVWDTVDKNPNIDLGGGYYSDAVPIIDKQIAKGGYRLGVFLNLILSKSC